MRPSCLLRTNTFRITTGGFLFASSFADSSALYPTPKSEESSLTIAAEGQPFLAPQIKSSFGQTPSSWLADFTSSFHCQPRTCWMEWLYRSDLLFITSVIATDHQPPPHTNLADVPPILHDYGSFKFEYPSGWRLIQKSQLYWSGEPSTNHSLAFDDFCLVLYYSLYMVYSACCYLRYRQRLRDVSIKRDRFPLYAEWRWQFTSSSHTVVGIIVVARRVSHQRHIVSSHHCQGKWQVQNGTKSRKKPRFDWQNSYWQVKLLKYQLQLLSIKIVRLNIADCVQGSLFC